MININYLLPILVKHKNNEYFCFIDYSRDNVYFLNDPEESTKQELSKEILFNINNKNLVDVKTFDLNSNNNILNIIKDIKSDKIRKKFSNLEEEQNNE